MAEPEKDGDAPTVDEDGNPETPAKVAVDKRKKRNMTYAGLALGAIAVVVAIVTLRKNASGTTAASSSSVPTLDPNSAGLVAGAGGASPSSSGDPFAALEAQLASGQQQSLAAQGSLASALTALTSELHATGGANSGDQTRALTKVNAAQYSAILPKGAQVDVIGADTAKGKYSGSNLRLGAPLYALINGTWRQGVNPNSAPAGTLFGTMPQFAPYIVPPTAPKLPNAVAATSTPHG